MTPAREALVLPFIFLTVALIAGLQIDAAARLAFVAPSLFALVLATVLVAALVRSGALAPDRLLHGSRTVMANTNGAVVLATLFAASAQLLALLIPRSGLPMFFVGVFLFVLLLNTLVATAGRVRLLRSLAITLGSTLLLKFVILAALSTPGQTRTARVLAALFDAATFGAIAQEPQSSAAGYLAFGAVALYLIGLSLLPPQSSRASTQTDLVPR
jgi:hypothetical protein